MQARKHLMPIDIRYIPVSPRLQEKHRGSSRLGGKSRDI